jgi:hypothetical protein
MLPLVAEKGEVRLNDTAQLDDAHRAHAFPRQ